MARCEAPTRKGRCPNKAPKGSRFCLTHRRWQHRKELVRQTQVPAAAPELTAAPVVACETPPNSLFSKVFTAAANARGSGCETPPTPAKRDAA